VRQGTSIGPYRVVRKIGEGGMGAVFLGEHTLIGRRAAIKILLPELSSRRDSVDRFFNEARATTAISDPGIVQVFDFGFTGDNVAYIVMELLEGEQLDVRLARLGRLSPADALRITRQAAGSLGAAHAAGIVHRDLKPENLYMIRDPEAPGGERPKILDFGIAKLGDEVPDRIRTRTGAVLGTPVYMSPEQCHGAGRVDHRADIYALGGVLFHLVTGRPPFDLHGVGALISAHLREPAVAPSSLVAPLPPGLDELVLRCLAKPPDDRFQTMAELQHACDAVLALISIGGAPTVAIPSGSMPMPRPGPGPGPGPGMVAPEVSRTTLGSSTGERISSAPRRARIGLWIAIAALAGGTCSAVAVLTGRSGPASRDPAPRDVEPAGAPPIAAPVAEVIDAAPAPVAAPAPPTIPEAPDRASAAAPAAPAAEPARREPGHASPGTHKPPRPVAKRPRKPSPTNDDLYDDRN
jgi:eukaryotic-like serine/threonine-protein kinase